jgi:hypothetical protein
VYTDGACGEYTVQGCVAGECGCDVCP